MAVGCSFFCSVLIPNFFYVIQGYNSFYQSSTSINTSAVCFPNHNGHSEHLRATLNHISGSARPCRTFQHNDYFRFHSKTCNGYTLRLYYRRQAVRRKLTCSRILYSSNVMASFNATILTLELSGDVPDSRAKQPRPTMAKPVLLNIDLPEKGHRIGQWNVNRLRDTKLNQIRLLLTSSKNIDVMFLIETFLKSSNPIVSSLYLDTPCTEKIGKAQSKAEELLHLLLIM